MLKFTKNSYVDEELYESRIRKNGKIFLDREKLQELYDYETELRLSLYKRITRVMRFNSNGLISECNRKTTLYYLQNYEYCPSHYFKKRGVAGESLDSEKVLKPLYLNGYAKEFLALYMDYNSIKSRCGSINSLLEGLRESSGINVDDRDIYELGYSVNRQVNRRYNYCNRDIISSIPKELDGYIIQDSTGYTSAITCPKGYCLARADFAQSDLRIAFSLLLRDESNSEIMMQYEDKYEAIARLVCKLNKREFDIDEFKRDRKKYKVHTLATIYGTENTVIKEDKEFISRLSSFVNSCSKYVEYRKRLEDLYDMELGITMKSYFGYEQTTNSIGSNRNQTINFNLNAPCQTGTSEIIILTVNKILDMFYENGYTEDDISVYMVRHDEPVFLLKEEVLKDAWIFEQASEILVDDWIPLKLKFDYEYYYGLPNADLSKIAEESITKNKDKIVVESVSGNSLDYYPVKKVANLTMHYSKVGDKAIATVCDEYLHAINTYLIESIDDKEIQDAIVKHVSTLAHTYRDIGYAGVCVRNNFFHGEVYTENILVKFFIARGNVLYTADASSKTMANLYAKKNSLEPPFDELQTMDLTKYATFSKVFASIQK